MDMGSANMKNGPGYFSDMGWKANETLTRDYLLSLRFSIASNFGNGWGLTSTIAKWHGTYRGDTTIRYEDPNVRANVRMDARMNLAVEYFHEYATLGAAVTLSYFLPIDVSAVFGTPWINFGGEATYSVFNGTWDNFSVGVSWATQQHSALSFTLMDKGETLRVLYWHPIGQMKKGAVAGEVKRRIATKESKLTIGCAYAINPHTLIKARMNQYGYFGAALKQEVQPNTFFTISGTFELQALRKTPRIGVALEHNS
ncbi:Mitochondrial outer membrane protein porin 2 [Vitis vinifera]|uniref:Mitochondrial outer membrane protein porin 2 n=1 Tax=Vitis vinifera TaxID=29760 RepID=A0A438F889_VITVI|nr:Mitochondrial outer membrane protein porin 2 [Vitis vinifera]